MANPALASGSSGHELIPDYEPLRAATKKALVSFPGTQLGDPDKFAIVLADVVRGEGVMRREDNGELREWPERLIVGSDAAQDYRDTMTSWSKSIDDWEDVVKFTDRYDYHASK